MIVLHIGAHKSGSSTIQQFMDANARKVEDFGVLYPAIGRRKQAHHGLVAQLRGSGVYDPELGGWEDVRALHEANPDKRIVISSEGLETLKPRQIAEVGDFVRSANPKILFYIRDLASLIPSRYNQLTKSAINVDNFDEFYDRWPASHYKFFSKIERWANVFGWENLYIKTLDKRGLVGGSLIEDFIGFVGIKLADLGGDNAAGMEATNVSLGWKPTEMLRAQYSAIHAKVDRHQHNKHRIRTDVSTSLAVLCGHIMQDLGLMSERAEYLSAAQRTECEDVWSAQLKMINEHLVGQQLLMPETKARARERPFLPSVDCIPGEERREVARRMRSALIAGEEVSGAGEAVNKALRRLSRSGFDNTLREAVVNAVSGDAS